MVNAAGGNVLALGPKVDIPKPSPFMGKREAKAVENFLWEMVQYFKGISIVDDQVKINTASAYLKDTVALWWRCKTVEIEEGTCLMNTWADFVREFKNQFYPENAEDEARLRLRNIRHSGSLKDYINEYTSIILEIPDLTEKVRLFNFLANLQAWARVELKRRGVQHLSSAISITEGLNDYPRKDMENKKPKDRKPSHEKGGGAKPHQLNDHKTPPQWKSRDKKPMKTDDRCFICDGLGHRARECPKNASLHVMIAREECCKEVNDACMGSMQVLNAIKAQAECRSTPNKGLQFVRARIRGNEVRAMVDTGATHSFMAVEEAKRLGVNIVQGNGAIKTVNTNAKPIRGEAKNVHVHIGDWAGQINFTIVEMDDFKVVLGMEFFDQVRAILLPSANSICIPCEGKTCMVNTERGSKEGLKTISAIHFRKGCNKKELCYLAVAKVVDQEDKPVSVPTEIKEVLEEFKDVMPTEFPKRLPLRREVDHEI
ncbi:uncharacterized protein LOC143541544 [Bidens hawaiensis]|uniref:uncharacterized protein LOC143541544 n=1 Tax=Bidens hawaiensis TaxID=980011 RepID=UPI00404AC520